MDRFPVFLSKLVTYFSPKKVVKIFLSHQRSWEIGDEHQLRSWLLSIRILKVALFFVGGFHSQLYSGILLYLLHRFFSPLVTLTNQKKNMRCTVTGGSVFF